ncbi:E3 SUMO-protein ligase ZBED1-like [Macrobrachium nipponense]|uniref:E3 SUMO-protein ligase ZBED1-like n=1 Tax=Macrobrachium nipponense TaxID=159736 RepID=UPI0030C7DBC5
MATRKRSEVWLYFEEHEYISAKVVCQICSDTVIHSGNTSNMLKHLKTKHESEYSELENKKKKELEQSETPTTSKTKQMSLLDSFSRIGAGGKYPDESPKKKAITNKLLKMIAIDLQPLSIVEDEGFVAFVRQLDPRYEIPSRRSLMRTHFPDLLKNSQAIVESN